MSRKHFRAIAEAVAALKDASERRAMYETLLPVLAASNREFSASKFREACNVE